MISIQEAGWVRGGASCEAPMFRREFPAGKPAAARIQICGLGFFELYLNGARVSDDLLVPAWTNYEPREDTRLIYPIHDTFQGYRTYYLEYDVLPYLREGSNALGIVLGNGWYHQARRNVEGDLSYGFPKLCFVLTVENCDGTSVQLSSGDGLKWAESEILSNNIYYGERHDLRKRLEGWSLPGYDDSGWRAAEAVKGPQTRLLPQDCPGDKIIRRVSPKCVYEEAGRRVYDCGENLTGWVVLRCPAAAGQLVRVRHSEELAPDGKTLDFASAGGSEQIQMDEYFCGEKEALCHPRFCWHGFRYFEVDGEAEVVEVSVIHADVPVTSAFECSDEGLNWLYQAYLRTQLGNYHCGVPSDCPHRERLGYTGDGQITARSALLTLGARKLIEKWLEDIADCQGTNGHVQHTAPFYGGGGGPGGWGGAIYIVPMACYEQDGNPAILRKYYPNIRLWLDYMDSRTDNGLVVREEEGGWCLGDWCTPVNPEAPEPGKPEIPEAFINTYYYIKGLQAARKITELLTLPEDPELERRQRASEAAFREAYYDAANGSFCKGVNGADAFGLDLGMGDARTLENLVERYEKRGAFDTGIFGTDLVVDVLFRYGKAALAYRLLTGEGACSFGYMRGHGATTLWEDWEGGASHNHPMFGGVVRALFTYILGIRPEDGKGYAKVKIAPQNVEGLAWARGSVTTPAGKITVSWRREESGGLAVESTVSERG